jgi:hypothetical protein
MVAAIILFSIAFIIFILGIVLWIVKNDPIFMLFLTISIPFCICGAVCLYPTPKKSDIENGTAIYQENHHIVINEQGDTIKNYKTYEIVWKEEYPYGKKK